MEKIDACGLSCPEPLLMLKKALEKSDEVSLSVDSKNSFLSCQKFAELKGFDVQIEYDGNIYILNIRKK